MYTLCVPAARTSVLSRLADVRSKAALTQAELGVKAGIGRATVANAEAGKPVRMPTVRKLAEALGVEPRQLMEE